jgi:hypothetical protein
MRGEQPFVRARRVSKLYFDKQKEVAAKEDRKRHRVAA